MKRSPRSPLRLAARTSLPSVILSSFHFQLFIKKGNASLDVFPSLEVCTMPTPAPQISINAFYIFSANYHHKCLQNYALEIEKRIKN